MKDKVSSQSERIKELETKLEEDQAELNRVQGAYDGLQTRWVRVMQIGLMPLKCKNSVDFLHILY